MSSLRVEFVSPEKRVWSGEATLVSARTLDGDLGILPGHTPLLGVLVDGFVSIKGVDGTVGAISAWESKVKEVGVGEQEITKIIPNSRLDFALRFKEPMNDTANGFMSTESLAGNQTKVKWGVNGVIPFPMNIMLPMMKMDQMIGNDLQKGLENLKDQMEQK